MFSFLDSKVAESRSLDTLLSALTVPVDDAARVWGPVVAYQYDSSGSQIIQHYVTALVHRPNEDRWHLIRQINDIQNGHEWTSRPITTDVSDTAARHWLTENRLDREGSAPARRLAAGRRAR